MDSTKHGTVVVGGRYGKITVLDIEQYVFNERGYTRKRARGICDCGKPVLVDTCCLSTGNTRSCGCMKGERNKTHGASGTRLNEIWCGIIKRCCNPHNTSYAYYGGRGIRMCTTWRESYEDFRDWSYENGYTEELTIDRIDVDGEYSPSNCRFVSRAVQGNNKRNNRSFSAFGETKTLGEWARDDRCVSTYGTLRRRIVDGWEPELAMTLPADNSNSVKRIGSRTY